MIKLTDVRIDAPSNSAHNILCDIVAHCGIGSVLLSLSEIVAAQQSVQADGANSPRVVKVLNPETGLLEDVAIP